VLGDPRKGLRAFEQVFPRRANASHCAFEQVYILALNFGEIIGYLRIPGPSLYPVKSRTQRSMDASRVDARSGKKKKVLRLIFTLFFFGGAIPATGVPMVMFTITSRAPHLPRQRAFNTIDCLMWQ
jgi:hypothetical protein